MLLVMLKQKLFMYHDSRVSILYYFEIPDLKWLYASPKNLSACIFSKVV